MDIDFDKADGLVPAVIQHHETGEVLMLGYMNREAYAKTIKEGRVCFFSRSRQALWLKGETSGNYLQLVSSHLDCDRDALLLKVRPTGPVCHKGTNSCFSDQDSVGGFLYRLERIIEDRENSDRASSYTKALLAKGINKVSQKFGEEAVELIIESKDHDDALFIGEAADLLYHFLVLLRCRKLSLKDIEEELSARHREKAV